MSEGLIRKKHFSLTGRPILCLFFLLVFNTRVGANVAPPGFWGAGHGSTLIPIFQEDTFAISQLQMEKERIEIDLYRNFAVVKGTYWFKNHSNQVLKLRLGYPINGSHTAIPPLEEIRFDDLYHLKVLINGKPIGIKTLSELLASVGPEKREDELIPTKIQQWEDWYVWELESLPEEIVKVEVYFIVKTNSTLTQGYGRKEGNAFEYIVHTGANWKNRILSGEIEVQLKDDLQIENIYGVNPPEKVKWSENWLFYSFSNLEPKQIDDLILWYKGDPSEFEGDFPADSLFRVLNNRVRPSINKSEFQFLNKIDFETPLPEFVYVLAGILLLFSVLTIGGIWLIVWFVKRRRKLYK